MDRAPRSARRSRGGARRRDDDRLLAPRPLLDRARCDSKLLAQRAQLYVPKSYLADAAGPRTPADPPARGARTRLASSRGFGMIPAGRVRVLWTIAVCGLLWLGVERWRTRRGDHALRELAERNAALRPTMSRAPQQLSAEEIAFAAAVFGTAAGGLRDRRGVRHAARGAASQLGRRRLVVRRLVVRRRMRRRRVREVRRVSATSATTRSTFCFAERGEAHFREATRARSSARRSRRSFASRALRDDQVI